VNVFFDVQGTLLTMEEAPRPRAREAFQMLRASGHDLYLWSSGGAGYAAGAAELLGVADLVEGCLDERQEPAVRSTSPWTTTREPGLPGPLRSPGSARGRAQGPQPGGHVERRGGHALLPRFARAWVKAVWSAFGGGSGFSQATELMILNPSVCNANPMLKT